MFKRFSNTRARAPCNPRRGAVFAPKWAKKFCKPALRQLAKFRVHSRSSVIKNRALVSFSALSRLFALIYPTPSAFYHSSRKLTLVADDFNILDSQYKTVQSVSPDTVLAKYLVPEAELETYPLPEPVLYPFGLNQSQKTAVERALTSQVGIIQGPPGTGKTQTILNILANAVRRGKTVAVVSSNNPATHNVAEKLEKKGLGFLTAFVGRIKNKEAFLQAQTGHYPNMGNWLLPEEEQQKLAQDTAQLSRELNVMLNAKNRIAAIEQELLQLTPEQQYFNDYYATQPQLQKPELRGLNADQVLALWLEFEHYAEPVPSVRLVPKAGHPVPFQLSCLADVPAGTGSSHPLSAAAVLRSP